MTASALKELSEQESHAEALAVLSFLAPEQARQLALLGRLQQWRTGEQVMGSKVPADFLAFVTAGKLAVKNPSSFPGRFILLAELERGSMVGEGALVDRAGGHHTVVEAVEDSRLLVLPRQQLQTLFAQEPVLAQQLLTRIIKVMRQRLRGAGERLSWIL